MSEMFYCDLANFLLKCLIVVCKQFKEMLGSISTYMLFALIF